MDIGLVLALISSVCFSVGVVLVRKTAGEAGESFSVTAISIFIGAPFFTIAIFVSGDWIKLQTISWQALAMLVAAGVIHFIIGRLLGYNAFRLIGANRANVYIMSNQFYAVLFAVLFLGEALTVYIIFGVLLMFAGVALVSTVKNSSSTGAKRKLSREEIMGILFALGAALCWGSTPILIKSAVEEIGSSVAGAFISFATAAVVMGLFLLNRPNRRQLMKLPFKKSILPMSIAGLCTTVAQLLFYMSLGKSPASLVIPLVSSQIVIIFLLSWLVNRKTEIFTFKVIIGMAATLAGTILLFQ